MQLLLVDNRVKDVETVTQSLLPGIDYVLVDFETDTYETLVAKIPVKKYESVGIFEENYELNTYQLVSSFGNSVLTNVKTRDPNLQTWRQYKQLLSYFKNTLQVNTLDLMGCNINSSPDWNYVIDYLRKQFQININSSNDNTGSPDFGGNWILESGNQNLIGKYFSNNIEKYQFILGQSSNSSYVIASDNKLYGCGNSDNGTMNDADILSTVNFTQVPDVTNISKLCVGPNSNFSFVIKIDGSLWATGSNYDGQLGTGNTKDITIFTKVYTPSGGVTCTAVSCGLSHTQILLSDGSVWATGTNYYGELGTGNTTQQNSFTKVYTPSGGITCTAVSCGSYHTQILLSDGSVRATGYNEFGQLGTGNTTDLSVFTTVYTPSDGITCTAVSCGSYHTHILLSDGSVRATGSNSYGQLGIENSGYLSVFTPSYTPSGGITCTAVSSGNAHTQILLSDGSVRATGINWDGQLGTGNTTADVTVFTQVYTPSDGITCTAVSCGYSHTQILLSDGSVRATGVNSSSQLGTGDKTDVSVFTQVYTPSGGVTCIAASSGFSHTQILLSDGSVRATGQNTNGQLGIQNGININVLRDLNINVNYISTGIGHIAVIKSDGSVWTKGSNSSGQLGTGDKTDVSVFTQVYNPALNNNITCRAVSCGSSYTHILLSDGSVRATGQNTNGQLGTGNRTHQKSFVPVYTPSGGLRCTAVSCGGGHTMILLSDGSVRATGANGNGQLGTGNTPSLRVFTQVYTPSGGITCTAVSCGENFTLILLSDGSVRATGNNDSGQLGTGDTTHVYVFTTVYTPLSDNEKCTAVSCGLNFTQLLLSDGSVRATGYNYYGQLGTGNTTDLMVFTQVYTPSGSPLLRCRAVSCGQNHTQILLSDGSVRAAGLNANGQIGNGNYTQQNSFVTMLNSDGTNMANVFLLPEMVPPPPPPPPPLTPTITSITASGQTVTIHFTQNPTDSTITGYEYSYSTNNGTSYLPFTTVNSTLSVNRESLLISQLESNLTYLFKIRATNGSYSDPSNSVEIRLRPTLQQLISQNATLTDMLNYNYSLQEIKDGGFKGDAPKTAFELLTSLSFFSPPVINLSNSIILSGTTTLTNPSSHPIRLTNIGSQPLCISSSNE